jgi:hypothetical protein
MAKSPIGRGYHSGSLLLPNGKILVFGGDPLFSDEKNTTPGKFEQRIEVYTAPQFFRGIPPKLEGTDGLKAKRGEQVSYRTDSFDIKTARLIPPSSTTHVTNIEQRSVGAVVKHAADGTLTIDIPEDENLLPNGWYMLFVTDSQGIPAKAKMIEIVR